MNEKRSNPSRTGIILIVILFFGISLCIGSYFIFTNSVKESFVDTKDTVIDKMTDTARKVGLSLGEKQHHTTMRATIHIDDIREISRLEVLRGGDVAYVISDKENGYDVWLSVPGHGVYTVDMQLAEIVTDEINNSISIRVPKPELTDFTIDYDGIKKIHFKDNKWIFSSVAEGVQLAEDMMNQGREMIGETLRGSFYRENAERSALMMIKNIAYSANPDNTELNVYVDFFD